MQVVDYGLALKSDSGNLLFSHLIQLLRLNMVLVQKNAYSRSIMMQLLNLMHQREHNLPSWQMFSKSTAVFNEEVGEHSFAILSRLVLGDTTKCSFKHMDTMYGLIHTYRVNNEDMTRDQLRKKRSNKRYDLDKKVETLAAIQAFMLHTIRQIKADAYLVYPGNPKKGNAAYLSALVAAPLKIPRTEINTKWERSALIPLNTQMNRMRKQARATYFGNWAEQNCSEQWPEMKTFAPAAGPREAPRIDFHAPEDSEDSSAGEEIPALEDSTDGEDPSDPSSSSSSEDEARQFGPAPYDPYDEEQGTGLILQNQRNKKCPWLPCPDVGAPLVVFEVPANAAAGVDASCPQ